MKIFGGKSSTKVGVIEVTPQGADQQTVGTENQVINTSPKTVSLKKKLLLAFVILLVLFGVSGLVYVVLNKDKKISDITSSVDEEPNKNVIDATDSPESSDSNKISDIISDQESGKITYKDANMKLDEIQKNTQDEQERLVYIVVITTNCIKNNDLQCLFDLKDSVKDSKLLTLEVNTSIARIYENLGDKEKSLQYYETSLELAKELSVQQSQIEFIEQRIEGFKN